MSLLLRDNRLITPALRDGAPTIGAIDGLAMSNSGSYFTEAIDVGTMSEMMIFIQAASAIGTNPTLDCDLQYGYLDSANQYHWINSGDSFTQITTNSIAIKKATANFGKYIRFRLGLGGTNTPGYTVTMRVSLKA